MIYESYPYKDELLKIAKRLRKRKSQKRWPEESFIIMEKDVFFACFIIRKLIEARTKISNSTAKMQLNLIRYPVLEGKVPNIRNNHRADELYDLQKGSKCQRNLHDVVSEIIHSYILMFSLGQMKYLEDDFSILFNSFKQRRQSIFSIHIDDFCDLLELIGNDYPSSGSYRYNERTQDYDVLFESSPDKQKMIDFLHDS